MSAARYLAQPGNLQSAGVSTAVARLALVLVSCIAIGDALAFLPSPFDHGALLRLYLQAGAVAAAVLAIAGIAIAWVWPSERPARLLGWCLSLAAFAWIDFTLAPFSSTVLPYRAVLARLGVFGDVIAFADRISLFLMAAALARFAVLFPRPLQAHQIPTHESDWRNLTAAGARVTSRLDSVMRKSIELPRLPRWLPQWLTVDHKNPVHLLTFWRWALEHPGRVWLAACTVPLLLAPGCILHARWLEKVGWSAEFVLLVLLALIAVWGIRLQYALGDADERRRLLWVLEGLTLGFLAFLLWTGVFLLSDVGLELDLPLAVGLKTESLTFVDAVYARVGCLFSPAAFLFLAALTATAFYRGDIDPRLAIRRTTVYGALGVAFLFLFAGLGNAAEGFLEASLGMAPLAGSILTGGTIAVALVPVKHRLDRFMNRILPPTVLAQAPTQEVVIVFSDIVGFIALTGADQKVGLTVMSVFQKAADRVAREHRGRFVKAVADEVILEFRDATDAVRAAAELQGEFHEAARELDLPTPEIRTGIHLGEVARSAEGDVFGDAVNVASRVQGVAGPGEVVLSEAVRQRLAPGAFPLEALGPKSLKNVAAPVECYRLVGAQG